MARAQPQETPEEGVVDPNEGSILGSFYYHFTRNFGRHILDDLWGHLTARRAGPIDLRLSDIDLRLSHSEVLLLPINLCRHLAGRAREAFDEAHVDVYREVCRKHEEAARKFDERWTAASREACNSNAKASAASGIEPKCPITNNSVVLKTYTCDHNEAEIECGGIKIIVPEGAIRNGDEVKFYCATALYGPFTFPSYHEVNLVSPYYWIGVSGSYNFQKPVQVMLEHFAVLYNNTSCDPSHFQLLSCEDDDKSLSMKPVNYDLIFRLRDDKSWCAYFTDHFCSYCLMHNCNTAINRISAFCLKPKNLQLLDHFTIEIWFSLLSSYCKQRNAELYTERGMILDTDNTYLFEASCDINSKSYFSFDYPADMDDWCLEHSLSRKITTKQVNFYNYYTKVEDLQASEKNSLYPPRFVLHVKKKPECTKDLDANIIVSLYDQEKCKISKRFKIFVPCPINDANTLLHHRNCDKTLPTLKDLLNYTKRISVCWKEIASRLGIPKSDIPKIDVEHSSMANKCYEMFVYWLDHNSSACWCQFIKALEKVGLYQVAQEAALKHLDSEEQEKICASKLERLTLTKKSKINLQALMRYLKLIPDIHLRYFVFCLLPEQSALKVIQDIMHSDGSREDNTKLICNAFLNEANPSWIKVYRALKEADCDDVADVIGNHFL